jgi:hypothetical protein
MRKILAFGVRVKKRLGKYTPLTRPGLIQLDVNKKSEVNEERTDQSAPHRGQQG